MSASESLKALGREVAMKELGKPGVGQLIDALPALIAVVEAAELVRQYDDAVIEWDSMKAYDAETAKAKRVVGDRATELSKQAFAENRAALRALETALEG